jgi:hypothetical protein
MTQTRRSILALGRIIKISMPEGDREAILQGIVESSDGAMVKVNFQQWVEERHDDARHVMPERQRRQQRLWTECRQE